MGVFLFLVTVALIVWWLISRGEKAPTIRSIEPRSSEGVFAFRFDGRTFDKIPDPPYAIMAVDYQKDCMEKLEPLRKQVEEQGGFMVVNLVDYLNKVQLRIVGVSEDLQHQLTSIVSEVPKPNTPVGTYAYIKREIKKLQARRKRRGIFD